MPTTDRCPRATPIPIEPERCRNEMRRRRSASEHGASTRWDDSSPDEYTRRAQRDEARRNIIGRSKKTDESPTPKQSGVVNFGFADFGSGTVRRAATPCLALALDKRCHRPVAVTVGIIARKFVERIGSTSIRLISLRGNGVVVGLRRSDAATLARLVWVPRYASEARSPHQRG